MQIEPNNKEINKVVLLAYIGEIIVNKINKKAEKYIRVREAMNFCWKWIEDQSAEIWDIYDFLDNEDEDDLVNYYLTVSENEKKEYGVILGVVSFISYNIMIDNQEPIPQFLGGIDEEYYNQIIEEAIQLNIIDSSGNLENKIIDYCSKKENEKVGFVKSQIMSLC